MSLRMVMPSTASSIAEAPVSLLDDTVFLHCLGLPASILDPLAVLRRQWCNDPTVHSDKATRPA